MPWTSCATVTRTENSHLKNRKAMIKSQVIQIADKFYTEDKLAFIGSGLFHVEIAHTSYGSLSKCRDYGFNDQDEAEQFAVMFGGRVFSPSGSLIEDFTKIPEKVSEVAQQIKDDMMLQAYYLKMEGLAGLITYYEQQKDETLEKIHAINVRRLTGSI